MAPTPETTGRQNSPQERIQEVEQATQEKLATLRSQVGEKHEGIEIAGEDITLAEYKEEAIQGFKTALEKQKISGDKAEKLIKEYENGLQSEIDQITKDEILNSEELDQLDAFASNSEHLKAIENEAGDELKERIVAGIKEVEKTLGMDLIENEELFAKAIQWLANTFGLEGELMNLLSDVSPEPEEKEINYSELNMLELASQEGEGIQNYLRTELGDAFLRLENGKIILKNPENNPPQISYSIDRSEGKFYLQQEGEEPIEFDGTMEDFKAKTLNKNPENA